MIFVTGDTHGAFSKFNTRNFPEQKEMTKEDYVIVCGDFGGVFDFEKESREEKWNMDWLEEKPFTTLFVDGNHENFDRLYQYPVEEWMGGKVHKIRPSVIHLMRGQVFTLEGKKFFTFGGASSHDISDGILEMDDPNFLQKRKWMNKTNQRYRINHYDWWVQEQPSQEEKEEGFRNLQVHNNEVDFIISHCCASSTQTLLKGGEYESDPLTDYLEKVRYTAKFKKWFFGHYHDDKYLNVEEILLYDKVMRIL